MAGALVAHAAWLPSAWELSRSRSCLDAARHVERVAPQLGQKGGPFEPEEPGRRLLVAMGAAQRLADEAVLERLDGGGQVEPAVQGHTHRVVRCNERPDGGG